MVNVRPLFRVVASGGRAGGALKLTLIATPAMVEKGPGGFPFNHWPQHVAGLLAQELRFAKAEGLAKPDIGKGENASATIHGLHEIAPAELAAVDALWGGLMNLNDAEWTALAEDIKRSLTGKKHRAALDQPYTTDEVAQQPKDETDGAILADRPQASDIAIIRGALSLAQADLATDMETVRAARVLAKMQRGRYWLDKPEDEPLAPSKPPLDQYKDAVDNTRDAAQRSARYFDWVKQTLAAPATVIPAPNAPQSVPIVPDPEQVKAGKTGCALRASHNYGTWLQRQSRVKWEQDLNHPTGKKMAPPKRPTEIVPVSDHLSRARSIFFALQSDPLLARLFGFAIDAEISAEHARALPIGPLHLWVASDIGLWTSRPWSPRPGWTRRASGLARSLSPNSAIGPT